jgi:hypothetical protein
MRFEPDQNRTSIATPVKELLYGASLGYRLWLLPCANILLDGLE